MLKKIKNHEFLYIILTLYRKMINLFELYLVVKHNKVIILCQSLLFLNKKAVSKETAFFYF
ncbi:hypothetical protein SAMN05443667_102214 [Flavobacterium gillisiae]|uniref:Uncharacterized protein n=1 Tax=Flavobacterium gillisiae TaxID=150146 RepID=A0A1H3Z0W1_9FLAO|nr:hypothetical protein SAMN05443667_102214 [Flavobacterium gillisiae]